MLDNWSKVQHIGYPEFLVRNPYEIVSKKLSCSKVAANRWYSTAHQDKDNK